VTALAEIRLLDGPNLYFPRAAAKVTLNVAALASAPTSAAVALAAGAGMRRVRPGEPSSAQRQAFSLRLLRRLVKDVARRAGTTRLAVRARVGPGPDLVVVAYPWRSSGRAEALGEGLGQVVDRCLDDAASLTALLEDAASVLRAADRGRGPSAVRPTIPVASVTGTNGKTTTTRLLAHLCMTAGLRTGWSSTDGVVVQGEMVEQGDYSGPAGGQAVLAAPGVQVGVLETARGGLLLKGMGILANDVSIVTNVSADHLGLQGVDTVDQLAEVKAIVTHVTKPDGWTVLNGDDPRVLAMRAGSSGRPFVFSLDPESPALREAINHGGRAVTVMDGAVTVLSPDADPDELVPVVDVPVSLSGLSEHNVANALAATAAGIGLGLPREALVEGLRTFRPDPALNPGRMNLWSVPVGAGSGPRTPCTVIVDLAHNEAGLQALLRVARGVVAPGGRLLLGLGTAGDRTDEILTGLGELAGVGADRVVIVHKERYLRDRTAAELEHLLRRGAGAVGMTDAPSLPDEVSGTEWLVGEAGPGDVVAVMVHADRVEVEQWLRGAGGTVDSPADVRAKVLAARGMHPMEDEIAALRSVPDDEARVAAVATLVERAPGDPRLVFEHAGALDSAGHEREAEPRYREALDLGLAEPHRTWARIQLASTLRNLGRPGQALAELDSVLAERPGSTAAAAFRALALHDLGRHGEAVGQVVAELAAHVGGTDAEGYARALRFYADELR